MKFINLSNLAGETVAINPLNITSVKIYGNTVVLCLGADTVNSSFRTIAEATHFIEMAIPSELRREQ